MYKNIKCIATKVPDVSSGLKDMPVRSYYTPLKSYLEFTHKIHNQL